MDLFLLDIEFRLVQLQLVYNFEWDYNLQIMSIEYMRHRKVLVCIQYISLHLFRPSLFGYIQQAKLFDR